MLDEEIKRVDFSAHILVNPFDEIKTCQESFKTLKKISELGFNKILLTPRYYKKKDVYASASNLKKQSKELNVAAVYNGDKIEFGIASEIFITPDIPALIFAGYIIPLMKKTLLIKLPEMDGISLSKILMVLKNLRMKGYEFVIMCPEKSKFLQGEPEEAIKKLSTMGAMFMVSYKSICGVNGRAASKMAEWMMKNGYCDLLGTEASSENDAIFEKFSKAEKKILRTIGEDAYEKIMRNADGMF